MHFVVYGAGAIGGVVGARLFRAGFSTTLVARGAHLAAMAEHGLVVDAADGRHTVQVPTAADAAEVDWSDDSVVLLCVKSQQTAVALDDLRAHAPQATPIVSAQNGVANEPAILRVFPNVYGLCVVLPALHLEPGVVVEASSNVPGILDIGRFPDGADDRAERIAGAFRDAGFWAEVRTDIMAWKYRKLMSNLVNGIDAAFRQSDAQRELVHRARAEGEAVLTAAGIAMVSEDVDREARGSAIVRRNTGEDSYGSSTWQSVARGAGSVEVDYLAGEIVLLGRQHGIPVPVNELVQRETYRLAREHLPAASLDAGEALRSLGG